MGLILNRPSYHHAIDALSEQRRILHTGVCNKLQWHSGNGEVINVRMVLLCCSHLEAYAFKD